MAEELRNLLDLIEKDLRHSTIEKDAPMLWKNTYNLYPDEIYSFFNHKNHHVQSYARACLVISIQKSTHMKREYVKFVIDSNKFTESNPNFSKEFNPEFDSALGLAIRCYPRLCKEMRILAEIAMSVYKRRVIKDPPDRKDLSLCDAYGSMQLLLAGFLWERIARFEKNMNEKGVHVLLEQIEYYKGIGYDLDPIIVAAICPILDFIRYRNHIIKNKKGFTMDVYQDKIFIAKMRILDRLKYYTKDFDEIDYFLENPIPSDEANAERPKLVPVKLKNKRIPNFMHTIPKKCDTNLFKDVSQIPETYRELGHYNVGIHFAIYNDNKVNCKIYNLKSYDDESLKGIYKEAKCFQAVSESSGQNTCFLRYFGGLFFEAQIILVFEKLNQTLDNLIKSHIDQNEKFKFDQIVTWTHNLLNSLLIMEKLGMHHGNITTFNMGIDDSMNIKLINFMGTSVGSEDHTSLATVSNIVIDQNDFSPPELFDKKPGEKTKYKPSKADIYSLGLVILRLMNLNVNFSQFKENVKSFKAEIEKIREDNKPKLDEEFDHIDVENYDNLSEVERKKQKAADKEKRELEMKRKEIEGAEAVEKLVVEKDMENPIYRLIDKSEVEKDFKLMLRAMLDVEPKRRKNLTSLNNMITPIKTRTVTQSKHHN